MRAGAQGFISKAVPRQKIIDGIKAAARGDRVVLTQRSQHAQIDEALRWPGRRLMLAGFSFGAFVALKLAQIEPAELLITVAPPVDRFDFSGLAAPRAPWLVVQGDADDIVDPRRVIEWVRGFNPAPHLVVVPGVGHFFHGHLAELRDAVGNVLRSG